MSKSIVKQIIELESKSLEELKAIYNDIMPKPLKTHVVVIIYGQESHIACKNWHLEG